MNVVFITCTPLAGAPIRIANALNQYTEYKTRVIDLNPNCYGNRTFEEDLVWVENREECLQLISQADILHFHHFFDIDSEHNPFNINFRKINPTAKIIRHFHSTLDFILQCNQGLSVSDIEKDKYPKLVVPHCSERTFLSACVVPNIIPIKNSLLIPQETTNRILEVFYSVSSPYSMRVARWETKGLPEVTSKINEILKEVYFDFKLVQNTPYLECMKLKQYSDIVIGDVTSGSYHLTDLEALSMGKPTLTYLDSRSQFVLQNLLKCDSLPFVNCRLEDMKAPFIELIRNDGLRKEIGDFSRSWIEKFYDDKVLVKYYVEVYEKLLNGEEISRQENLMYPEAKRFLYNTLYDMQWENRVKELEKNCTKDEGSMKIYSSLLKNIFSVQNEYRDGIKRKVIRLLGIKCSFKVSAPAIKTDSLRDDNVLKISFFVSGGFGDYLINANYIYNFCKYIGKDKNINIKIDIISPEHQKHSHRAVFKNDFNLIDNCYIEKSNSSYDVTFSLHSLLEVNYFNEEKVARLCPKILDLIKDVQKYNDYYKFFAFYHTNAYHIAIANGKNRLQLADINGKLGIEKSFTFPVLYPANENEILSKFNLSNKIFITLNRGVDKNSLHPESTKIWALNKYQELVKKLKEKYPDIMFVQLGASKDKCRFIEGVDIDLRGKTNLEDIKVLVKNSILHIDCEGGFAHLRAALKAPNPAIVIFGPTSPDFYGYDSNINVYARNACPICCDWIIEKWQQKCLRNQTEPPCIEAVSVSEVFGLADKYLGYNK